MLLEHRADDGTAPATVLRSGLETALATSEAPIVLAVSGGRDSMTLLHAMGRWCPERVAAVATFDHGTGVAATSAASLVVATARRLGIAVVRERARGIAATENAWRMARWSFLKRVARAYRARVATAHTRDDQVETIVLRELRGTGARGLAALAASSGIVRPWLTVTRADVARWAAEQGVEFVEDPSNATRAFFRSRVRHDLLPALEAACPGFAEGMWCVGEQAAAWRRDAETLVASLGLEPAPSRSPAGAVRVPVGAVRHVQPAGLAILWPALMARVGVSVNRRGTRALVAFTGRARTGHQLELAGGGTVVRVREGDRELFELRGPPPAVHPVRHRPHTRSGLLPARFAGWQFTPCAAPAADADLPVWSDAWTMPLPADGRCAVRRWQAADRICTSRVPAGRRVARYFSEARVPAVDRREWPVVVMDGEIVWVPGVCRSLAAPNRPGRPDLTWYRCEREHG